MPRRDTKVTCPCCESQLEVDALTGHVVRWRRKTELDERGKPVLRDSDWEAAQERALGRQSGAVDKFDASLKREKQRGKELDDLFRSANERAKQGDDED